MRAPRAAPASTQTLPGIDALLMISRGRWRASILLRIGAQRDKVSNPVRQVQKTSTGPPVGFP